MYRHHLPHGLKQWNVLTTNASADKWTAPKRGFSLALARDLGTCSHRCGQVQLAHAVVGVLQHRLRIVDGAKRGEGRGAGVPQVHCAIDPHAVQFTLHHRAEVAVCTVVQVRSLHFCTLRRWLRNKHEIIDTWCARCFYTDSDIRGRGRSSPTPWSPSGGFRNSLFTFVMVMCPKRCAVLATSSWFDLRFLIRRGAYSMFKAALNGCFQYN